MRTAIFLLAGVVLACDAGSSDSEAGAGAGDGADGADGSDGTATGGGACDVPAGGEVVLPWSEFAASDGLTGPAYGLLTDGASLFINLYDRIVAVPLAGGSAVELYRSPKSLPLGLQMWDDENGIIVYEAGVWSRVPYAGGGGEALTVGLPNGAAVFDWDRGTDRLLAALDDLAARTTTVYSVTLGHASALPMVEGASVGYTRRWVEGGGTLYTQGRMDPEPADHTIYRFVGPDFALPEALTLTPPPLALVGADEAAFYYSPDSLDPAVRGLYRVVHGTTTSERVVTSYWSTLTRAHAGTDGLYVNDASALWHLPDSGPAVRVASVPATGGCTTHEVLGHEGWLYTVTFRAETGENQVWRVRQP